VNARVIDKMKKEYDRKKIYNDIAIIFQKDYLSREFGDCSYWKKEFLTCWNKDTGSSPSEGVSDGHIYRVSYSNLIETAYRVAKLLVKRLKEKEFFSDRSSAIYVVPVIGIAIPEGPYLPLSVASVHILQTDTIHLQSKVDVTSNKAIQSNAILVPLDPREGTSRLQFMMEDASPSIVLAMPGRDIDKLKLIAKGNPSLMNRVDIVDMTDLVLESSTLPKLLPLQFPSLFDRRDENEPNAISHIVYTSGTTGRPKGCVSSMSSLLHYLCAKNSTHSIDCKSIVYLASSLSFDPCFSDILSTIYARATLAIAPQYETVACGMLGNELKILSVTHILCTPSVWSLVEAPPRAGVQKSFLGGLEESLLGGLEESNNVVRFGALKVVALGGEPIPNYILRRWAPIKESKNCDGVRLFSTYGVTESCVYQTIGEVFSGDVVEHKGQDVGLPFPGTSVHICSEISGTEIPHITTVSRPGDIGEIVLFGAQIDEVSHYWKRTDLSYDKFVMDSDRGTMFYRTGDKGYVDVETGRLHILGRIGYDTMIKFNGVRVELGDIESAIRDDEEITNAYRPVVLDCKVTLTTINKKPRVRVTDEIETSLLIAYCVLSSNCLDELGINFQCVAEKDIGRPPFGILCTSGSFMTLLRERCAQRVPKGCVPSSFVIIEKIPLGATGKTDRRMLPDLEKCIALSTDCLRLWDHGKCGSIVADEIVSCLNLQPCQRSAVTVDATFASLGGDSLSATRLVRALYAKHHGINDSRNLGGEFGRLDGPFDLSHLLRAKNFGEYVDWLDTNCLFFTASDGSIGIRVSETKHREIDKKQTSETNLEGREMYDALLEATALGMTSVALALLKLGVDPQHGTHKGRMGKVTNRITRRQEFKASPMHLACSQGNDVVVCELVHRGWSALVPDANGIFPIHLACAGGDFTDDTQINEMQKRLSIVKCLLDEANVPLAIMDGNKQTVLHSTARSGNTLLLSFLLERWTQAGDKNEIAIYIRKRGGRFDWSDRWFRSPVHWAVLNGKARALQLLLDVGCDPEPSQPKERSKSNRRTSAKLETPIEICLRKFTFDQEPGVTILALLKEAINKNKR